MPDDYSSGSLSLNKNTLRETKEDIRLDQLIPADILKDKVKLQQLLKAYYKFLNIDEFTFLTTETFEDTILDNKAVFRISDPELKNNKFFQDPSGTVTTIKITQSDGTVPADPDNVLDAEGFLVADAENITISNGNDLPESLTKDTITRGKTLTIKSITNRLFTKFNGMKATLTTVVVNYTGPGPSYVLNEIERNIDIDEADAVYLDKIQKEIAPILPRNLTVDKRTLYKQIIDFYKLRGSEDAIKTFFRLVFNDIAEVETPIDKTLIPSSGKWESNPDLVGGGQYLNNKGFLSDTIKIQDSDRFHKFSYVVKSGQTIDKWRNAFKKLVHPAGFKFFGEILILLQLINAGNPATQRLTSPFRKTLPQIGDTQRELFSAMPYRPPGVIGIEDIPVLVEAFAASFGPGITAIRGEVANIQLNFHTTGSDAGKLRTMADTPPGVQIINPGSGYIALPSITFNANSGAGNPTITFGSGASDLTADGGIDPDKITIGSGAGRGSDITSIVASIEAPKNASNVDMTNKIVSLRLHGLADKIYNTAPTLAFSFPTARDGNGNLSGTRAEGVFTLDAEKEISGFNLTNNGSGYILDPIISLTTGSQNEDRVKEDLVKQIISLNHQGTLAEGNFRTIINNNYTNNKGSNASTRLYNRNTEIEHFSSKTIENLNVNDINSINTKTFINIE